MSGNTPNKQLLCHEVRTTQWESWGGEDWQIYAFQAFGEKSLANT